MIHFNYQITKKDFIDYYDSIFYEQKGKWIASKLPLLVILSFLFFLLVLIQPTIFIISVFTLTLTLLCSTLIFIPLLISYYAKVSYQKNDSAHYQNDYLINEESITITTKNISSVFKWQHLERVFEGKKNLYCIFSHESILIIPKIMVHMEQLQEFIKQNKVDLN